MAIIWKAARGAGLAAALILLGQAAPSWGQAGVPYAAACHVDEEIAAADRAAAEAAGLAVARSLLAGTPEPLRRQMSQAAQAAASPAEMAGLLKLVALRAPYDRVQVAHTYRIDITGGRDPYPKMICGRSLADPNAVALSMTGVARQFHVEVTAHTINNDWSIFVWLIPEGGELKALALNINLAAISGRTSPMLGRLAQAQASRAHLMNAALLYRAAEGTAVRGPNAVPAWKAGLDKAVGAMGSPKERTGGLDGSWRLEGETFSGNDMGVLGVGGDLNLMLVRRLDRWPDLAAVDQGSRAFVTGLVKDHPELADSFAAIVVRAMKPDGTGGLGTVYEFGKGFGPGPAGR